MSCRLLQPGPSSPPIPRPRASSCCPQTAERQLKATPEQRPCQEQLRTQRPVTAVLQVGGAATAPYRGGPRGTSRHAPATPPVPPALTCAPAPDSPPTRESPRPPPPGLIVCKPQRPQGRRTLLGEVRPRVPHTRHRPRRAWARRAHGPVGKGSPAPQHTAERGEGQSCVLVSKDADEKTRPPPASPVHCPRSWPGRVPRLCWARHRETGRRPSARPLRALPRKEAVPTSGRVCGHRGGCAGHTGRSCGSHGRLVGDQGD